MSDKAHNLTDEELAKLERKIANAYKEAADEMRETVESYFASFAKRDEEMKAIIGTIQNGAEWTEQDYQQWRLTQIGRGKRYEVMRDALAERYTQASEIAIAYVNDDMAKIYALNRSYTINSGAEQAESWLADVNFNQYDENTVKRLLIENPDLMPNYPEARAVKRGIDLAYGKQQINASVTSSILQGKSIDKIANDLQARMQTMSRESAVRAARTAITNAENAGRQDGAEELEAMGCIMEKEWIATHDSRTRDEHAEADGQIVPLDEPFIVGGEKLMYPGDSSGSGWNIYNCRCSRFDRVTGFKSNLPEDKQGKIKVTVEET